MPLFYTHTHTHITINLKRLGFKTFWTFDFGFFNLRSGLFFRPATCSISSVNPIYIQLKIENRLFLYETFTNLARRIVVLTHIWSGNGIGLFWSSRPRLEISRLRLPFSPHVACPSPVQQVTVKCRHFNISQTNIPEQFMEDIHNKHELESIRNLVVKIISHSATC